jgi:hypothetical protein
LNIPHRDHRRYQLTTTVATISSGLIRVAIHHQLARAPRGLP